MSFANRRQRPDTPADELARQAAFPKPQHRAPSGETDTRELQFRKIHPERDLEYRRWLRFQDCSVKGLTDSLTDQLHICWSPELRRHTRIPLSDPAHTGKSYISLKRSDVPCESSSGMFSLCRHAHRQQEDNMDEFDRRFGINRHVIARRQHAQYLEEKERGR